MTEGSSAAPGDLPRFTLPRAMTFAYDTLGDAFEFASAREGSALRRLMMMHFSDVFVIDTAGNFQFREEPSGMVRVQFGKDANGAIEVQALPGKRFIDLTAALAELLLTVVHEIDGWPVIDMGLAESVAA